MGHRNSIHLLMRNAFKEFRFKTYITLFKHLARHQDQQQQSYTQIR